LAIVVAIIHVFAMVLNLRVDRFVIFQFDKGTKVIHKWRRHRRGNVRKHWLVIALIVDWYIIFQFVKGTKMIR
jgi:hypothetical protein